MTVWAPSVRQAVTNKVADPYSLALTADAERSLVVDLGDTSSSPPAGRRTPSRRPCR
ncbi:hypothetical protein GCM10020295_60510 [Streptomyces cinereospinus]